MKKLIVGAAIALACVSIVEAKPRTHKARQHVQAQHCYFLFGCPQASARPAGFSHRSARLQRSGRHDNQRSIRADRRRSSNARNVAENGQPSECYGIPWCGCWLRLQKGITDKAYNLAVKWREWGTHVSGPVIGAVAYMRRRGGSGHVGIVEGVDANGNPIIKSGNHGNRVATTVYPKSRIVEYRIEKQVANLETP